MILRPHHAFMFYIKIFGMFVCDAIFGRDFQFTQYAKNSTFFNHLFGHTINHQRSFQFIFSYADIIVQFNSIEIWPCLGSADSGVDAGQIGDYLTEGSTTSTCNMINLPSLYLVATLQSSGCIMCPGPHATTLSLANELKACWNVSN
jgi:hypothetical protein